MPTEIFATATAPLRELRGQRVWSLMISLFGDLARGEGQAIGGPVLSAMMTALDVRPEAARVALHRLRKDNWIASRKQGRISQHSLTPEGRAQSEAASGRIYATVQDLAQDWQLLVLEDADPERMRDMGFAALQPRIYIGNTALAAPRGALVLPGQDAPDWLKRQLEPAELTDGYTQLAHALGHARDALPDVFELTPLQIATLRCLIVHNWRRLALKHPALPRPLMREDWAGLQSQILVTDLLAHYPRPPVDRITAE